MTPMPMDKQNSKDGQTEELKRPIKIEFTTLESLAVMGVATAYLLEPREIDVVESKQRGVVKNVIFKISEALKNHGLNN